MLELLQGSDHVIQKDQEMSPAEEGIGVIDGTVMDVEGGRWNMLDLEP